VFTTEDFDKIHWHDNAIHAFRILEDEDGCCGDIVLDIDFIEEWLPPIDNAFSFKVAPSDLTFHEVSDLVISVNYASASAAVQPMTIREIHREVVTYPNGYSSFAWEIELNWPPNSFIKFCSKNFSQVLRMEPVISGAQYLSPAERK
jgi:hypothetical protein